MLADLQKALETKLTTLGIASPKVVFDRPAEASHGDYSTNIALIYAKELGKNPKELADLLAAELTTALSDAGAVSVAGPGFINITFTAKYFADVLAKANTLSDTRKFATAYTGKKVLVEYTQPNPFKPFHIGHLMSNAIGESLARLFEASGAILTRVNYQGDIGLHVAKAIWALMKAPLPKEKSNELAAAYIGEQYAVGSAAYDENLQAKEEIDSINRKLYEGNDPILSEIYAWGRSVTLAAFEDIYEKLGTKFDQYFFESEMAAEGEEIVRNNVGKVFTESQGAIVFHAENYDPKLHTRVFVTSQGLPTYDAKELALAQKKFELFNPDLSITETANEQLEVIKVATKVIEVLWPDIRPRMEHVMHGLMRFADGKMSSRKGNVVTGEQLLKDAKAKISGKMAGRDFTIEKAEKIAMQIAVAAIKYSILRSALGSDIIFDFEKSISFEGDSGPYLQYSVVRARGVLAKAKEQEIAGATGVAPAVPYLLERFLSRFDETVLRCIDERAPHHLVNYLTELASAFNTFYAHETIADKTDALAPYKIVLTEVFVKTMTEGLWLLGIEVPEKM